MALKDWWSKVVSGKLVELTPEEEAQSLSDLKAEIARLENALEIARARSARAETINRLADELDARRLDLQRFYD